MKILKEIKNIWKRTWVSRMFNRILYKWRLSWSFRDRSVLKATILYYYIIGGGGIGILYAIVSVFVGWPITYALSPIALLFLFVVMVFVGKNWNLLWLYLRDIDQGRFLLLLNERTHFQQAHKVRVAQWVYPRRNQIRNERWVKLGMKIKSGEITKKEKREHKKNRVGCPQQLIDGINQAILIDCLIYAHRNIRTLDDEIREIMQLTDEHILAFNLQAEVNKCRTRESRAEIERLTKIGNEISKRNKEAKQ